MSNDLSIIFAGVIAQAAKAPATTGVTEAAKEALERRADRLRGASSESLVLLDVSGSMAQNAGAKRKIDLLREAVQHSVPSVTRQIAFHSFPVEVVPGAQMPEPQGSTALHSALAFAAQHRPRHTLVVSDGHPDDAAAALAAAARLTGIIDVLYVGPDGDREAIAFMQRLAKAGTGRVVVRDIAKNSAQIGPAMRQMLALPGGNANE